MAISSTGVESAATSFKPITNNKNIETNGDLTHAGQEACRSCYKNKREGRTSSRDMSPNQVKKAQPELAGNKDSVLEKLMY